jgi:hypothetical protein
MRSSRRCWMSCGLLTGLLRLQPPLMLTLSIDAVAGMVGRWPRPPDADVQQVMSELCAATLGRLLVQQVRAS